MKRIEFIAPVEAMRGNLSGAQKGLEYPANDNKAYESPLGSTNYARNYRPSFIGAKRASDGLKYFAVKTKTATHVSAKSKKQMALMGGAGAIIAAVLRTPAIRLRVEAAYGYEKSTMTTQAKSLRDFMTIEIMKGLSLKRPTVFSARESISSNIVLVNPWVSGTTPQGAVEVPVSNESLVRFWGELANNPIEFEVETIGKGVAHQGDTIEALEAAETYNVLDIQVNDGYAILGTGDGWLTLNGVYVDSEHSFTNGEVFGITSVEPEP